MTYRTHNARLMRRLGFTRNTVGNVEVIPADKAAYWRHQPSNALVITMHEDRYTEPQVVRAAIYNAVYQTHRNATDKVSNALSRLRHAHEEQGIVFAQTERAKS